MLRDRIVVGIRDQALSERLQCDAELTLEKVKRSTRQREAVKEQHKHLQGDGSKDHPIVIEQVRNGAKSGTAGGKSGTTGGKSQASRHQFGGGRSKSATPPARHQCKRCGRYHAKEAYCPARQARCSKCNRKGHFGAQCFSKTIENVDSESRDWAYVFPVNVFKRITWSSKISVGGKELTFKLDTGAEVTVITEEAHRMLEMPKLQKPSKALYGPTSTALRTLGQFTSTLSVNNKTSEETIFVVQGLKTNLLGLLAITSLQLVHRIQATSVGTTIPDRFPKVFRDWVILVIHTKSRLEREPSPMRCTHPRMFQFLSDKSKKNFDSRHRAKDLPQLQKDTEVWITSGKEPAQGTIVGPGHTPRSYVIKTDKGEVRRNRGHLKAIPKFGTSLEIETPQNTETGQTTPTRPQTRSQTGCQIKRPMKLDL